LLPVLRRVPVLRRAPERVLRRLAVLPGRELPRVLRLVRRRPSRR
jgi:hypothetical protein